MLVSLSHTDACVFVTNLCLCLCHVLMLVSLAQTYAHVFVTYQYLCLCHILVFVSLSHIDPVTSLSYPGVKGTHTTSNNTFEVEKTLGIEAAR